MIEPDLHRRSDDIGVAGVLVSALAMALPWWAWRRRARLNAEANRLISIARSVKDELKA